MLRDEALCVLMLGARAVDLAAEERRDAAPSHAVEREREADARAAVLRQREERDQAARVHGVGEHEEVVPAIIYSDWAQGW